MNPHLFRWATEIIIAADSTPEVNPLITPIIAGSVTLLTGIVSGIILLRNRKKGALEQRAPDVTEAWAETQTARQRSFLFEDLFYEMRGVFKAFARRAIEAHPELELTQREKTVLERDPSLDA